MKKALLFSLVGLLSLAFAASMAFAATTPTSPPVANNQATLTDAQKQELAPLFDQMLEVRKQILQKQVSFGILTQEQADQRIAWMQERAKNGFAPGKMGRGPGMMRGYGPETTLTDSQKQELAPLFDQMLEIHKQMIQKQVAFGNLTQEQADQRIAWLQERAQNGFGPGMMGRGHGRMHGYGSQSNLTDEQKQELAPLFTQMFEIRKQIIQKQVDFGNLTQEQADQRIAWMQERAQNGFGPGMMGRGHGMGHGPGMMGGGGPGYGPCQQQAPTNK